MPVLAGGHRMGLMGFFAVLGLAVLLLVVLGVLLDRSIRRDRDPRK